MRHYALVALAGCCLASPAFAQSSAASAELPSPADLANKDSFTIGVGGALIPDYEGSDDYRLIPAAAVRGKVSGISFSTRGTYLYVDVIPQSSSNVAFDAAFADK